MKLYFLSLIMFFLSLHSGLSAAADPVMDQTKDPVDPPKTMETRDATVKKLDKMDDLTPQFFEGKLKMKTNFFTNSKSYVLVNQKGEEIGILELGSRALVGNVTDFLDEQVRVYGTAEPNRFGPSYIINATSIQLQ